MPREVLLLRTEPKMHDAVKYLAEKNGTSMQTVMWIALKRFLDRQVPRWSKVNVDAK